MHNHARMWFASYLIHWRACTGPGAAFFLEHLLDADPASNNLSWQWVASAFSHKPYFFNRENLERYTGAHCAGCVARATARSTRPTRLERSLFPATIEGRERRG